MSRCVVIALASGVLVLVACGADAPRSRSQSVSSIAEEADLQAAEEDAMGPAVPYGPFDQGAEMRPDLMRVDPAEIPAGGTAELHFPEETDRGEPFVLEQRDGTGWHARFLLLAGDTPRWIPATEPWVWDDIGVAGPGPDRVVIPDAAPPGDYRICTANAVRNFCGPVTVTDEEGD